MSNDETVEISYDEIRHVANNAVLFIIDNQKQWIPKSLIYPVPSGKDEDGPGEVTVMEWFAIQEGLI